jgi:hypothetical protein
MRTAGLVAAGIVGVLSTYLGAGAVSEAAVVRTGAEYTLEADAAVEGDLYLVGERITTQGSTTGDVLVVASAAELGGPVGGDVLVAAGNATVVSGPVDGDFRAAAGELTLATRVAEDAIILGGNVILTDETTIGGDLLVYADYLEIAGTVNGHVEAHARSIIVHGTLLGQADFDARESFTASDKARLADTVRYSAPREGMISDAALIEGEIMFTPTDTRTSEDPIDWWGALIGTLVSLGAGVALLLLFPAFTRRATEHALANNGSAVLVGLVASFAVPVCIVLAGITIVGAVPALALFALYGLGMMAAFALSPVLAGAILARWLKKGDGRYWAWVSLGAFTLSCITLLPIVGFLVRMLVFFVALGTLAMLAYESLWKKRHGVIVPSEATPESGGELSGTTAHEEPKEKTDEAQQRDNETR